MGHVRGRSPFLPLCHSTTSNRITERGRIYFRHFSIQSGTTDDPIIYYSMPQHSAPSLQHTRFTSSKRGRLLHRMACAIYQGKTTHAPAHNANHTHTHSLKQLTVRSRTGCRASTHSCHPAVYRGDGVHGGVQCCRGQPHVHNHPCCKQCQL